MLTQLVLPTDNGVVWPSHLLVVEKRNLFFQWSVPLMSLQKRAREPFSNRKSCDGN